MPKLYQTNTEHTTVNIVFNRKKDSAANSDEVLS